MHKGCVLHVLGGFVPGPEFGQIQVANCIPFSLPTETPLYGTFLKKVSRVVCRKTWSWRML